MLESMTSLEWAELQVLCKHELVGYDREDFRHAKTAQAMAGGRVLDYFPPRVKETEHEQTIDDMIAALIPVTPANGDHQQIEHSG